MRTLRMKIEVDYVLSLMRIGRMDIVCVLFWCEDTNDNPDPITVRRYLEHLKNEGFKYVPETYDFEATRP